MYLNSHNRLNYELKGKNTSRPWPLLISSELCIRILFSIIHIDLVYYNVHFCASPYVTKQYFLIIFSRTVSLFS